jgi:hypothetical protein
LRIERIPENFEEDNTSPLMHRERITSD